MQATLAEPLQFPSRSRATGAFLLAGLCLFLSACAIRPYDKAGLEQADFLQRAVAQEAGGLVVSAAVPDAQETIALTGLDLYKQGIQPVWLRVENGGDSGARLAPWSMDRDYFSPIEVAYMNRSGFSRQGYRDMERWFHDNAMPRQIPAGESRSGLVYTHLMPGTKGFNLNIFGGGQMHDFTFFVPLPGFVADFMEVDFDGLYGPDEIRDLTLEELRGALEHDLGCCATDPGGTLEGGPFNAVLVGSGTAVRRSLLRGQWRETAAQDPAMERARAQRYQGRRPDAIFSQRRPDGNERIQFHLWLAPWRVDGQPTWFGQVYYWTVEEPFFDRLLKSAERGESAFNLIFARESVAADLDSAQRFLLQNFWYNGSLLGAGYVDGVGAVDVEQPRTTFGGTSYYTQGSRLVLVLSEPAVALDDALLLFDRLLPLEEDGSQLFQGRQVQPPNDRLQVQQEGNLTVTTAVPSAPETRRIFGQDLYQKNVQPVWIQVENTGDSTLMLTPMGVDRAYYSPREAANRSRPQGVESYAPEIEQRSIVRLRVAPHSIQSGYLFTRVDEGTKSFNVDLVGDGVPRQMTFFVPVPGLKLDHYEVDIPGLYPEPELRHVNLQELVAAVEELPCCVRDASGEDRGDPLNLVFVGEISDLYYAFMRAGWDETETIYRGSLFKTAASALSGGRYRYSPVSALYVFGRPQDAALQRARTSIHERNHLRVWLTPLRFEGKPVWIGQISRDIGVRLTWRTITTHKIDPDVDETREFLVEDLAYAQALERFGYVGGVGPASYDSPRGNLTGDPYFTDGRRVVMWISGEPTALSEIEVIDLGPYQTGVISD